MTAAPILEIPASDATETESTEPNSLRDAALAYAKLGLKIVPVRAGTKVPHIKNWPSRATSDPAQVAAWWGQWPDANVGIDVGKSGLVLLDVDDEEGEASVRRRLCQPDFSVATPAIRASCGVNYLYRKPSEVRIRNSAKTVAPGIDIRGDGGLALLPPSRHPSGTHYAWANPLWEYEFQPIPDWLVELIQEAQPARRPAALRRTITPVAVSPATPFSDPAGLVTADHLRAAPRDAGYVLAVAKLLGIPDPEAAVHQGRSFCCVVPGHDERQPSAKLYRKDDGIFIYKDFHGEAGLSALSLAEAYHAVITGRLARLSSAQNGLWSLQLMIDTRLVHAYPVILPTLPDEATPNEWKVYEGVARLFATNWRYREPGTPLPFSRAFAANWCGVLEGTAGRAIARLRDWGILITAGEGIVADEGKWGRKCTMYLPGTGEN
jgi:hypothetical protein